MKILDLEMQQVSKCPNVPSEAQFQAWAKATLEGKLEEVSLVVRVVNEAEMTRFNTRYRGKDGPTNVLSFPFEVSPGIPNIHIGDLILCVPQIEWEAKDQEKELEFHWAHVFIHGLLHLLKYDHYTEQDAVKMETEEGRILQSLGFPDPYAEKHPL